MKELLKKLVRAESTQDAGELKCAQVLADYFKSAGLKPQVEVWDKTRANITVKIPSNNKKPGLLFVSHLDVVPAEKGYGFEPVEKGGKIFGRGTCDMKAGMASAAAAIVEIIKSKVKLQGDILFSATAGEETDSCGIKNFVKSFKQKPELAGIIVPEPTNFDLVTAHRGLLWLEITIKGKSAHSSMPQLGINAIDSMRKFLNNLSNFKIKGSNKLLGKASLSVNKIKGGTASNIIPDLCSTMIDIRTVPGQKHSSIISDINKILVKSCKDAEISILRDCGSLQTNEKSEFVKRVSQLFKIKPMPVPFTTDAPYLTGFKAPIVIFGPGLPSLCHKVNEHIEIKDINRAVEVYKKIILHFLG